MAEPEGRVYVGVVGVGGVGTHTLSQLLALRSSHPALRLALLSSSTRLLTLTSAALRTDGDLFRDVTTTRTKSSSSDDAASPDAKSLLAGDAAVQANTQQIADFMTGLPGQRILIDNTSSLEVVGIYARLLKAGVHIATPNKKAFSAESEVWDPIQAAAYPRGGMLYHESTVGAGLPILSTLKDLIVTGDKVVKVEGVFSGTMSFLFNNFDPVDGEGGKFSAEVTKARDLGYTEPDPRDDLDGSDVARKLTILGRILSLPIPSHTSFSTQSLIPGPLSAPPSPLSVPEFLTQLADYDADLASTKERAHAAGKVVRYVGSIDVPSKTLSVGLKETDKASPIANLKGSDNIVAFTTERYGEQPLVVQGAGAGGAVTAMGVVADVVRILERVRK